MEKNGKSSNYSTDIDWKLVESDEFKKYSEYRSLWEQWGDLLEGDDLIAIEHHMEEIGKKVGGRFTEREKTMTQKVKEWIEVTDMPFRVTQIYDSLQTVTNPKQKQRDRNAIRQIIHRLKADGVIQNYGNIDGAYRKVDNTIELLHPHAVSKDGIKFHLPFGMDKMGIKVFGGNIITIAGEKSAGKTALCLALAKHNRNLFRIRYVSSEMWDAELGDRLDLHEDITRDEWDKIEWVHRKDDLADIVEEHWLHFFDYLELKQGQSFEVGDKIDEIHTALDGKGLAVVALQLDPGKEIARGGPSSIDKPRLILTLKKGSTQRLGTLKIWDAKNLKRGSNNPSGKIIHFKLVQGSVFMPQGTWHYEDNCSEETCGVVGKKDRKQGGYS